MQEYNNYTVLDNDGRENFLACLFPEIEYQEIKGFGGAFTEAASTTLDKLSRENREKIMAVAGSRAINVSTLKEALVVAFKLSSQGDYIILSPASCSFDMFKNYKEKAKCFKEAVKEIRNGEY